MTVDRLRLPGAALLPQKAIAIGWRVRGGSDAAADDRPAARDMRAPDRRPKPGIARGGFLPSTGAAATGRRTRDVGQSRIASMHGSSAEKPAACFAPCRNAGLHTSSVGRAGISFQVFRRFF